MSVAKANAAPARKTQVRKTAAVPVKESPSGAYKLQVAAVRSRGEAERLAAQLKQKHSGRLGARVPLLPEPYTADVLEAAASSPQSGRLVLHAARQFRDRAATRSVGLRTHAANTM